MHIKFCKLLKMLTLPCDLLGRAEMWLCFRFGQVVAWKTNLGDDQGGWHDQSRRVVARTPILYPLWVPSPPSHLLEGLCAGDEGGTEPCRYDRRDPLWQLAS